MIEKHFFLNFIRKLTLKLTFSKDMNLDYAKKFQIQNIVYIQQLKNILLYVVNIKNNNPFDSNSYP